VFVNVKSSWLNVQRNAFKCDKILTHFINFWTTGSQVNFWTSYSTRSSATAEKQCVSCAHIPRLASWPVDDHAFTLGGSMYSIRQNCRGCIIFWHSNALIHEMLEEKGLWHKIALNVIEGHSLCNQLQADKGFRIILLAVSPKFSKTWPAKSLNIAVVDHPRLYGSIFIQIYAMGSKSRIFAATEFLPKTDFHGK